MIIDEAHNLTEAVASIHSIELKLTNILASSNQVQNYLQKYESRLNEQNAKMIKQLDALLQQLSQPDLSVLEDNKDSNSGSTPTSTHLIKPSKFIFQQKLDKFEIKQILAWCEQTSLARKLIGTSTILKPKIEAKPSLVRFILQDKENQNPDTASKKSGSKSENSNHPTTEKPTEIASRHSLFKVISFLEKLYSETATDARISISKTEKSFKYLLLNSANVFKSVLTEPRSVIIAGGTMKPIDSYILQLLPEIQTQTPEKIKIFTCGHIVDSTKQLTTLCLKHGPTGQLLDYRFFNRTNVLLMQETYRILHNFSKIIPAGMVVFFPSYKVLETYQKNWEKILAKNDGKIGKKLLLVEPKKALECEQMLKKYENLCQNEGSEGAVILSVVGGKLAEGINFNDDLGRGVFIIGQPYPDIKSPMLQEKLTFLKENNDKSDYAETLCWRAINQSIGRAIRHQKDYASIFLLDARYCYEKNLKNLPDWMRNSVKIEDKFGKSFSSVREFFKKFEISSS